MHVQFSNTISLILQVPNCFIKKKNLQIYLGPVKESNNEAQNKYQSHKLHLPLKHKAKKSLRETLPKEGIMAGPLTGSPYHSSTLIPWSEKTTKVVSK